jgi:polysaccharide deacetylase 2 family uncharacterized protein YibQ
LRNQREIREIRDPDAPPRRWPRYVLAALLGAAIGIPIDRSWLRGDALLTQAEAPATEPAGPPPEPAEPEPARVAVLAGLTAAAIPDRAIAHGLYPLTGPGRRPHETLPLVSFACPAGKDCAVVLRTVDEQVSAAGYTMIAPAGGDQPERPLFRALAKDGRPALALRAFPTGPRLTVVLEQLGREPSLLDALLALDPHVTYAVLPNVADAGRTARRLIDSGREVIADLPLEPTDPHTMDGPDFLTAGMPAERIQAALDAHFAQVPGVVGAGAHLGDKFATAREPLTAMLESLKSRGFFFFDDLDGPTSLSQATARVVGVRSVRATHRIDDEGEALAARLRAVEAALVLDGHAVVVLTPRPGTLVALRPWLDGLRQRRIHLLRLSEVAL